MLPHENLIQLRAKACALTRVCPSCVALAAVAAVSSVVPHPGRLRHCAAVNSSLFMYRSGPTGLAGLCQVTEHLYLSNGRAASDPAQLARREITCVVDVTETGSSSRPPPPGVEYIHIPVADSPLSPLGDHFDEVAGKIQRVADSGGRTLVHCNAGVSRSAALCIAYLMRHRGATLLEAHGRVKTCRPVVRPNAGFWKQLVRYEMELRGCNTVRMVSSSIGEIPDLYEEEARNMAPL